MTPALWIAIAGLFISVGLITGLGTSFLVARTAPERRRLREASAVAGGASPFVDRIWLTEQLNPTLQSIASKLPMSAKDMGRLRRRLASAGIYSFRAAVVFSLLQLALPVLFAAAVLSQ